MKTFCGTLMTGLLVFAGCRGDGEGLLGNGSDSALESNAVSRKYSRPAPEVWQAIADSMTDLELKIEKDKHDALGGELTARRANKDKIVVSAKSLDVNNTQVHIAVAPGDRRLADLVHERIGQKLGVTGNGERKTESTEPRKP